MAAFRLSLSFRLPDSKLLYAFVIFSKNAACPSRAMILDFVTPVYRIYLEVLIIIRDQ
jgi:hypothetical protein